MGILAIVVIYNLYRYYHVDDSCEYSPVIMGTSDNNQVIETNMEETISTRQLALSTIEHIGSEPKYTEEGRFKFEYQDATFLMETVDECPFVNLILPWVHSCSIFDVDEFSRLRRVVNDLNWTGTCQVFYTLYQESDEVAVHIKKHFLLVPKIDDIEGYLKATIDSLFITARTLDVEIEKCRLQECEK